MNTATSVVVTTVVVSGGRLAEGNPLDIKVVVGGAVLALFLSVLSAQNEVFASKMALLVLVAALVRYMIPIAQALGFVKK